MTLTGLDQLTGKYFDLVKNKKVGVLCHPASIDKNLLHVAEKLKSGKVTLELLLGPEHGIHGQAQDMEFVESAKDPFTNILCVSLYGKDEASLYPKEDWLKKMDVLLIDLQDIGSRYYTFIYTMAFCMKVAARTQTPVIVLDRPNPIGGHLLEGNLIQKGFHSFVGAFSLPNRHGMTAGELALYFNEEEKIHCNLNVVPLKGWNRRRYFDELKYPWVAPSPNMPNTGTALVYPGMCLLEGTEVSEGRGTTLPFEIFGAPYIDPQKLKKHLSQFKLPSVKFRPLYFKPKFQKFENQVCGGLQMYITKRKSFRPVKTGMAIIKAIHDLYPKKFEWRIKAYEFVTHIPAIDLLMGTDRFRKRVENGTSFKEMTKDLEEGLEKFKDLRRNYLLY